jgi:hypothetical protein
MCPINSTLASTQTEYRYSGRTLWGRIFGILARRTGSSEVRGSGRCCQIEPAEWGLSTKAM